MKHKNKTLLTSIASGLVSLILLSGCGLKGSLYQTPEQPNESSAAQQSIKELAQQSAKQTGQ